MLVKALGTTLYRQFGTSAICNRSFTLSYIIPDKSNQVKTYTFVSAKYFRVSFSGFLFTNPKTDKTFAAASLPDHVDPTITYIAEHPFLTTRQEGYNHNQTSDRQGLQSPRTLPEEKPCHKPSCTREPHTKGWRFLTGEKDIAEWEGMWESCDGHHFFLEAKHFMDTASFLQLYDPFYIAHIYIQNKFLEIERKLTRSLDFLGIDPLKATVYVAGNHWLDEGAIQVAQTKFGFGILACNGLDLDVQEPITS
jgi:hypothetical protein